MSSLVPSPGSFVLLLALCHEEPFFPKTYQPGLSDLQGFPFFIRVKASLVAVVKNPSINAGNAGSIPRLGRSPREENGNPFRYSYMGNPMDRRAWCAIVHRVAKASLPPPHQLLSAHQGLSGPSVEDPYPKPPHTQSYCLQPD